MSFYFSHQRALDLSQGHESPVVYAESDASLEFLMQNLTKLTDLDISGTNLSGFLKDERESHSLKQTLDKTKPPQ